MIPSTETAVPAKELVELCALDSRLYCRTFFPQAFRQASPVFHTDIFSVLEDQHNRYCAIKVFRGGAKTTLLRAYTSKRIAYGISRTILFVSEAQGHSVRSVSWLKKQIEHNEKWTQVYGLERGSKWTDELIEIRHRALDITIAVGAYGITGQVRGVNIDDYRPDLIVVDDPCDEENTSTEEQRSKMEELFFGALEKSLTPETESPDAKMVLLQTPLHKLDLIAKCCEDPAWTTRVYGCFAADGRSVWPERFPTETLLKQKQQHIERGQTLLWLREMECKLIDEESTYFRREWLQYYDTLPPRMTVYIGIDPVPPPSERELEKDLRDKCDEALVAVGVSGGRFYLLEYAKHKGHEPDWTITTFFSLVDRWNPLKVRLESINYQRTLKWLLELEMRRRKRYVQINPVSDKRKKRHRIQQAVTRTAGTRSLYIRAEHHDFIQQYEPYPDVTDPALLDAFAMAVDEALEFPVDDDIADATRDEESEAALPAWRRAP